MAIADRSRAGALACAQCGAALAHDQRYCVRCGTRRSPLPGPVATAIERIREPDPILIAPHPAVVPEPEPRPPPRTISFAVMAMLAFGVLAGSLTAPGGVPALARTLYLSLPTRSAPPPV